MTIQLSGKKVLITGGTGELGSRLVAKMTGAGADTAFTYFRSVEKTKKLETLGARGFYVDLADRGSMDAFLEVFLKTNESLDILIHNAAAAADNRIEKMTEEEWDRVIRVNLKAPFYLTQKLLPLLMMSQPSKVFMLVSRAGLHGLAGAANYAASKGGLIAMTKTLAKELGRKKILVNAVNPGFMRSSLTTGLPEKILQKNLEESPLKTFSDPEEVADFLLYLSSDRMRQATGQVFHFESRPF